MNDRVPLRFRLIVAGMYTTFIAPLALIFICILYNTGSLTGSLIFLPILGGVFLILSRKNNAFVDRHRIDIINFWLNYLLAIGLCTKLVAVVGTTHFSDITVPRELLVVFFVSGAVLLFYLVSLTIAVIFALRGQYFKNRLIYPFIRYE